MCLIDSETLWTGPRGKGHPASGVNGGPGGRKTTENVLGRWGPRPYTRGVPSDGPLKHSLD